MILRGHALLLLGALFGLQDSPPPDTPEAVPQQAEEEARPPLPKYESPREVVDVFLDAMRDGNPEKALTTFEGWDGKPTDEWLQVARDLYYALQRTRFIEVDRLPGAEHPWTLHTLELSPESDDGIVVVLASERVPDGGWRLSAERTLAHAATWRQELRGFQPIEEVIAELPLLERWHYRLERRLPDALLRRGFLIANWKWFGLLGLLFLAVVFDRLVRSVAGRVARKLAKLREIHLNPDVLLSFERPMGLLGGALLFEALLPILNFERGVLGVLLLATSIVATFAGVWAAYRLVDVFGDYLAEKAALTSNRFDDMLVPLARRTLKLFVIVVGLVFVASRLSEDFWGIVAGLGLGSIAVGFAARDSIENLFGTFTVLLDKPFQIGDWIVVGDLEGTVEQVGFRSTRIRTFYNSVITVPNRTFISSSIDNMGERRYRRIKTMLSLTYDTPPEKIEAFCEGVRQIVRSHPYTRKDYYHVYLNAFGASSLDVLLYCFVAAPDWGTELREKHRLFADVLRLAEKLGVSFAFPTQTLHMARAEDLEHPDSPPDDTEGARRGRAAADEIVAATLRPFGGVGKQPPPVSIPTRPVGGDEGEG